MVRIVDGEFWHNYDTYEATIRRCFISLYYTKFPHFTSERFDNVEASYNNLLVELNRLRIFERFDVTKPDISQSSIDKKLEQYLYKWTESILYKEYHDRKRRTLRFRRVDSLEDLHRDVYKSNEKSREIFANEDVSIDENFLPEDQKKEAIEVKEKVNKLYKRYPTLRDIPAMSSEKYESPLDAIEERETLDIIMSVCSNDREMDAVRLKKDGLSNEEVAESLGCSASSVDSILNKLCDRYHKRVTRNFVPV
jgi:RNA polymerase sigma factor (sigma-70 family)